MAEPQPPALTPAATTTGDIEEELPQAKSAEDRKAAAALSSLDARPSADDDSASTKNVDQEAVRKAMDRLAGKGASDEGKKKVEAGKKEEVKKVVKVDQGDVTLLVSYFPVALHCSVSSVVLGLYELLSESWSDFV
jgi:hypothetical protein